LGKGYQEKIMGQRGPQRKSAEYLRLNGSTIDDERGLPTSATAPTKPAWIAELPIASAKWDDTVAELLEYPGLICSLDADALALYCEAWQTLHNAQAIIVAKGMVSTSEKGGAYQHPAVGIANKAREQIVKLGHLFGLNPQAREGMIVAKPTQDELEDLIR
jgi:P27 family predicted phage terminase small subunit